MWRAALLKRKLLLRLRAILQAGEFLCIASKLLHFVALGLAAGEAVVAAPGGGGDAPLEFILVSSVRSTAATVLVTASIWARTCSAGTLLSPAGTSKNVGSTSVLMSRNSATILAALTP